jgi:hypothetical protein
MSDEPPRPRSTSMPAFVWGLLGVLIVALFVLALALLNPI